MNTMYIRFPWWKHISCWCDYYVYYVSTTVEVAPQHITERHLDGNTNLGPKLQLKAKQIFKMMKFDEFLEHRLKKVKISSILYSSMQGLQIRDYYIDTFINWSYLKNSTIDKFRLTSNIFTSKTAKGNSWSL